MEGDFDFVSYDLDKMFTLLAKSNPTVFEWIRAHLIYFNELPQWDNLQQQIIENYDMKALYHHYLSMCSSHLQLMKRGGKFTYKAVFYSIRSLLSAELAAQHIIPELLIERLFQQINQNHPALQIARESLERKRNSSEKQEVDDVEKPVVLATLQNSLQKLQERNVCSSNCQEKLEKVLSEYAVFLKREYY